MINKLTVLHINKFHYLRGGSEVVYFQIARALEEQGHKSIFFSMQHSENTPCETEEFFVPFIDFNNLNSVVDSIKGAGRILYSFESKKRLSKLLDKYNVDIAHLHNVHHQISPSILDVLESRGIPSVMTLHDYKMVCTSYNLLVNERPCEVCVRGNYHKAVRHKCVKDSVVKSMLGASEMYLHHKIMNIYNKINIFIAPSVFLQHKIVEMGFDKRVEYIPNFIDLTIFDQFIDASKDINTGDNSVVYFGRLTPGKGLHTLLDAASLCKNDADNPGLVFKIIGDGPLNNELREVAQTKSLDNVRFLGFMKGQNLFREIKKSLAVVVPSEWYENNPMSVIESFALYKPVIGSAIAGIPELVKNGVTGLTFKPEDATDLYSKVLFLSKNPKMATEMGNNARLFVKNELNAENYYLKLIKVYTNILSEQTSKISIKKI